MRSTTRSGSDDRPAARALAGGFTRLRFASELEAEFRRHHLSTSQRWVRPSILVALGTTLGFAMIAEPEYTPLVGARLLLVTFFLYFMLGMRFVPALRTNLIVLGALIVAGLAGAIEPHEAIYLAFAVLCANVIGGAGAYALEHANRTSFLERRLLGEMAALDGLTQLLNRQTFEARVSDVWREATARQLPISVLMIDVDDFKRFNDHYGHLAGDDCLQRIAQAVRTAVAGNPADLLARYGGEELIAVLIDRSAADAQAAAERIVAEVAALAIPHAGSSTGGNVSISVGAATHHPAAGASYNTVAKLADNALYAAKNQGRNRCVCVKMQTLGPAAAAVSCRPHETPTHPAGARS